MTDQHTLHGVKNDYALVPHLVASRVANRCVVQLTGREAGKLRRLVVDADSSHAIDEIICAPGDGASTIVPFMLIGEADKSSADKQGFPDGYQRLSDEPFATGAFSNVFYACDAMSRLVAVKVMSSRAAWQRECANQAWLEEHCAPAILVRALASGELSGRDNQFYITYPLGAGFLNTLPVLNVSTRIRGLAQLAEAVAWLHERQRVHGDIKPNNLIYTPDQGVGVIDFGLLSSDLSISRQCPNLCYYFGRDFEPREMTQVAFDQTLEIGALGSTLFVLCRVQEVMGNFSGSQLKQVNWTKFLPLAQRNTLVCKACIASGCIVSHDELSLLKRFLYSAMSESTLGNGYGGFLALRLFELVRAMLSLNALSRPSAQTVSQRLRAIETDVQRIQRER